MIKLCETFIFMFTVVLQSISTFLLTIVTLYIIRGFYRSRLNRIRFKNIPTRETIRFLGDSVCISRMEQTDILDYITNLWKVYGPVVHVEIFGLPHVFLNDPKDIEIVLNSNQCLTKGIEYKALFPWLCGGLLTSTGNKWHMRRKMLTPTFHFKILENFIPIFNRNAKLLTKKLTNAAAHSELVDIDSYISLCTLDIICETAMGTYLDSQMGEAKEYVTAIRKAGEIILKRSMCFWIFKDWIFNMTSIGREFNKTVKQLHRFTEKVIRERKERYLHNNITPDTDDNDFVFGKAKNRKSFLDCLIEIQMENPTSMPDLAIREEVDTFMFEGHDTTSLALSWALFLLALNPDVQDKVHSELHDVFGDSDRDVTFQDLQNLQYLELVVKETLRLYPSVPYISRFLTSDLKLKDYVIPSRTNITITPYLIHRHPDYYDDPEAFIPERFLPSGTKNRHPFSYIPFSAGHRNCIGQKFAMLEEKVVLSTVLRKLRIKTTMKANEIKVSPQLILRPYPKIELTFEEIKDDQKAV